jgi:transcriptional regulator of aromatic amino acid metabolism
MEKLKNIIKEEIRKILREGSEEKLYKIEGLLVSDNDKKTQSQLISDIRAITGVTTVDTEEYTPRLPKKGRSYNKLGVKIDPYPYLKNGTFDIETLQMIIDNINRIKGVVKFRVDNPQLINVGI